MSSRVLWLPNWLGLSYAKLYNEFRDELFTFEEALGAIHSGDPKLVLSLLRRRGWLTVFGRDGKKRLYRLLSPHHACDSLAMSASVIPKQERYANLVAALVGALGDRYKNSLRSVAVFGSVGRGTANHDSDMDALVVAQFHRHISSRIDELVELEWSGRVGKELAWLRVHGVSCHISWFPLTTEEAVRFRPLYLDMVEDAFIVYDKDGLLRGVFNVLRSTLERQRAKRVWLGKDRWYWTLNSEIGQELVAAA